MYLCKSIREVSCIYWYLYYEVEVFLVFEEADQINKCLYFLQNFWCWWYSLKVWIWHKIFKELFFFAVGKRNHHKSPCEPYALMAWLQSKPAESWFWVFWVCSGVKCQQCWGIPRSEGQTVLRARLGVARRKIWIWSSSLGEKGRLGRSEGDARLG